MRLKDSTNHAQKTEGLGTSSDVNVNYDDTGAIFGAIFTLIKNHHSSFSVKPRINIESYHVMRHHIRWQLDQLGWRKSVLGEMRLILFSVLSRMRSDRFSKIYGVGCIPMHECTRFKKVYIYMSRCSIYSRNLTATFKWRMNKRWVPVVEDDDFTRVLFFPLASLSSIRDLADSLDSFVSGNLATW